MSADVELQVAIVAALTAIPGLSGVFDGAPARAEFPYVVVDCGSEKDWSFGQRQGREIDLVVTIWDDHAARLLELEEAIAEKLSAISPDGEWQLASLSKKTRTKVRNAAGPWASSLKYRARMLQLSMGEK